jgi:hypothetical protein
MGEMGVGRRSNSELSCIEKFSIMKNIKDEKTWEDLFGASSLSGIAATIYPVSKISPVILNA